MSGGENTAKSLLYEEAKKIAERLSNGDGSDIREVAKGVAFVIQMLKPLYDPEFVTTSQQEKRLKEFRRDCPVHMGYVQRRDAMNQLGFSAWGTLLMPALRDGAIVVAIVVLVAGKLKGWF